MIIGVGEWICRRAGDQFRFPVDVVGETDQGGLRDGVGALAEPDVWAAASMSVICKVRTSVLDGWPRAGRGPGRRRHSTQQSEHAGQSLGGVYVISGRPSTVELALLAETGAVLGPHAGGVEGGNGWPEGVGNGIDAALAPPAASRSA
ncbi:hypothetical protein ACFYPB_44640 [Streptomyces olivaceoviridis]|uniref:hypothetical protein n=1 Tax=Streptomyces olivaceoviridis TaxID=1921 RepID=UPI00368D76F2